MLSSQFKPTSREKSSKHLNGPKKKYQPADEEQQREYRIEAEKLPYHNHREYLEYVLSQDSATRPYAARASYLLDKENKTPIEVRELELLIDESTRPFAARIIELEKKSSLTKLEECIYGYMVQPMLRPYAEEFIRLINMNYFDRTRDQNRVLDLLVDNYSIHNAHEIVELENKSELTPQETSALSYDYLFKIAKVMHAKRENYDKKHDQVFLTPQTHCETTDIPNNYKLATVLGVKQAIDQLAKTLIEASIRQSLRKTSNLFFGDPLQQPRIQELCGRRSADLALALIKLFYVNNVTANQETLGIAKQYLRNLVDEQKISFDQSGYRNMYAILERAYKTPLAGIAMHASEKPYSRRP